jgi:hypothetical protein
MKNTLFLFTITGGLITMSPTFAQQIGALYPQIVGDVFHNIQAGPPSEPIYEHPAPRVRRPVVRQSVSRQHTQTNPSASSREKD